ncbi:MAG TPA: aromatic amino acid lyase [Thermoanaerobaculia bacterium]|nr:aromatic amino acid lyase [Thermoanaerobaculia bacterium]
MSTITLDGSSLTLADLARIARDPAVEVECSAEALARVARGRRRIERMAEAYTEAYRRLERGESGEPPVLDYGVTTGFGEFKNIPIAPEQLELLQRNILLSHAVGVGESADREDPASYFPPEVVRAALAVRLNAFLKGHSGVRPELVEAVRRMLVRGVVPRVPTRGSVGSSGDLCPLAHLFVVLLGEGDYYLVRTADDLASRPRTIRRGLDALAEDLADPAVDPASAAPWPSPGVRTKEGLALTNGATFSAALLALAVHDGEAAAEAADLAAALSLEAVCGCARALDPKIHALRGHRGAMASAERLRAHLAGSRLLDGAGAVQDVYSLRCAPQVHGAARDALAFARTVAEQEINAATDNPLFFPEAEEDPWDWQFRDNWPPGYDGRLRASFSAGNFHGEPVGMAADFLAIGLAELASISERRTQMLLDGHHNRGLPPNLIPWAGVNSGLMIAQYSAAGIVSENKVLAHPASVDSIPTSANSEDHNAMATFAARKLRTVLGNTQAVLAIELLVAAQAIEWRTLLQSGGGQLAESTVRGEDPGSLIRAAQERSSAYDSQLAEFAAWTAGERRPEIAGRLGAGTGPVYLAIRRAAPTMHADRRLDEDVRAIRALVETGELLRLFLP